MIVMKSSVKFDPSKLEAAKQKAAFKNFGNAAASIRKSVQKSIRPSRTPSKPGKPPRTRGIQRLKQSILYSADELGAIVGPSAGFVGTVGEAHEFGGEYKGGEFPARPFMAPALEQAAPRFADSWRGSIGE